jgi:hypothetical protein
VISVRAVNLPSGSDAKPHSRVPHDGTVTITRQVSEVMICCASPKANEIDGVPANDTKTAGSYKAGEKGILHSCCNLRVQSPMKLGAVNQGNTRKEM